MGRCPGKTSTEQAAAGRGPQRPLLPSALCKPQPGGLCARPLCSAPLLPAPPSRQLAQHREARRPCTACRGQGTPEVGYTGQLLERASQVRAVSCYAWGLPEDSKTSLGSHSKTGLAETRVVWAQPKRQSFHVGHSRSQTWKLGCGEGCVRSSQHLLASIAVTVHPPSPQRLPQDQEIQEGGRSYKNKRLVSVCSVAGLHSGLKAVGPLR